MDEVDNIIIHTLKQIGCDLPDQISTLREFTVEMVVQAAAKCIENISPEQFNIPSTLPPSMSARFRIGSSLAVACQELGFKGEIGYQAFLYANEHELRKVLMFLIEKLQKESAATIDEPLGKDVILNHRIATELKRQLSVPWSPSYTKEKNVCHLSDNQWFFQGTSCSYPVSTSQLGYPVGLSKSLKLSKEQKLDYDKMPYVTMQPPDRRDCYASILEENTRLLSEQHEWEIEWNHAGIASRLSQEEYRKQKRQRLLKRIKQKLQATIQKNASSNSTGNFGLKELVDSISGGGNKKTVRGSRFTHAEKLQFAQDDEKINEDIANKQQELNEEETEEERQRKREQEVHDLRDQLNALTQQFSNAQLQIKQLTAQDQQVKEQTTTLEANNKEEESAFRVKKKTFDLLPDAAVNINKLQQLVDTSSTRLVNLNDQWEKHRGPLVEKYRELKEQSKSRTTEVEAKIEEIRLLREKMKTAVDETRGKDEILKQLISEFERLSTDVNRSAYTKRILEIVGNIKKQKEEITKILLDTKSVQKDINLLTGKLDRTFTVTDELIFKDAKKDEFSRKAYKLLANLHEGFGNLVRTVENIGAIMREARDIEEQIDFVNEREVDENMQKISTDLTEIKKENNDLISKIKKKK